jgi:hypothetical protein
MLSSSSLSFCDPLRKDVTPFKNKAHPLRNPFITPHPKAIRKVTSVHIPISAKMLKNFRRIIWNDAENVPEELFDLLADLALPHFAIDFYQAPSYIQDGEINGNKGGKGK